MQEPQTTDQPNPISTNSRTRDKYTFVVVGLTISYVRRIIHAFGHLSALCVDCIVTGYPFACTGVSFEPLTRCGVHFYYYYW